MSGPRPEDLRGEALRMFETWRALGLNEAQAMREVAEAGLVDVDPQEELASAFVGLGESAQAARLAARGRPGSEGWVPSPVGRPGRARSAWSWQVDDPEPSAAPVVSESRQRSGDDAALVAVYERAVRVAQASGLSAEQAQRMVRRRMAEACGLVVSEATESGGRR